MSASETSCHAAGLGCMGMSGVYGPADEDESIATIHAALDAGLELTLSPDDLVALQDAAPADAVAGGRYAAAQMADLDSER